MYSIGQCPKGFINYLLILFVAGVLLQQEFKLEPSWITMAVLWSAIIIIAVYFIMKQNRLVWLAAGLLFFISGIFRISLLDTVALTDVSRFEGQEITLTGVLEGDPKAVEDKQGVVHIRYVVDAAAVRGNDGEIPASGKVVVYSRQEDGEIAGRSGDGITVSGIIRLVHGYNNPGRMDTVRTMFSQGIRSQLSARKHSLHINQQDNDWLLRFAGNIRNGYRKQMEEAMPKTDAAAIFAMLFGGYDGIRPELLESFTATGIVHILSVSGSHITLLAATAGLLGRMLCLPQRLTIIMAVVTIVAYGILAGGVPPVIRSAIMGILTLLATSFQRERDAGYILSLTALCMLLYNPYLLYDISFQLSFGATAGLIYIAPEVKRILAMHIPEYVAAGLGVTVGAQLSVLPLIAWYFNVISLSSLLANIVVVPFVEWLIVLGLFAGLAGFLIPFAGKAVFIAGSLLLGIVYELTRLMAALPWSRIYVPSMRWWHCIIYYLLLGAIIWKNDVKGWMEAIQLEKRYVAYGVLTCFAIYMIGGCLMWQNKTMTVHFIDVGQGNSALVTTPHGHAFMIDTGGVRDGGYDVGSRVDVPYLLHYGIRRLDCIFLTHAHDDHAGGVGGILDAMPVGAVMIGHEGKNEYIKTIGLKHNGLRDGLLVPLKEGAIMELDGVRIEVLYSPEAGKVLAGAGGNEYSNLIRVSYGKASFLFTGDLVTEQEAELIKRGINLRSTVLQVGHHGSHTSSSAEFLHAVKPVWSVIPVGYGNTFGHPHEDILERLREETSAKVLRTDQQGAIVFRTDGEHMSVETFCRF